MPIAVTCPACHSPCSVADNAAGQAVACPRCKKPFRVASPTQGTLPGVDGATVDAPPLPSPAPAAGAPSAVGRYLVRKKLGAGAFGAVYRAHDPQLERDVALKLLKPEALASPAAVERFRREAKAAAKMLHANIVPVYDSGEYQGAGYVVSAFIEGRPLADLVSENGMEPRPAVKLVVQLLEALAYAHEQGVMHRDVKPANCLVDGKGRLYLTDFGLAGSLQEAASRMTRVGSVMGTPAFMAPEQAAGATGQVGPHSDQYAAGVVLYELLTGRVPFEGPVDVVLFNVIRTQPQKPSSRRPGLDPALEAICLKAMAKKPADRFADVSAFASALRGWLAASKMQTGAPSAARTHAGTPASRTQGPDAATQARQGRQDQTKVAAAGQTTARDDRAARTQAEAAPTPGRAKAAPLAREPDAPKQKKFPVVLGAGGLAALLVVAGIVGFALLRDRGVKPHEDRRANGEDKRTNPDEQPVPNKDGSKKQLPQGEAARWLEAAEKGDAPAMYLLGRAYYHGQDGAPADDAEAVRWLERGHEQGNVDATTMLGLCHLQGRGGLERDPREAMRLYQQAQEKNCSWAPREIGILHANGLGVKVDHAQAVKWYRLSADRGDDFALHLLAECYATGRGVDRHLPSAVVLWQKAAAKDCREAKQALAALSEADRELSEAHRSYLAGALNGNAQMQYELGGICSTGGKGLKVDHREGLRWLRLAEKQGHPDATAMLGCYYALGTGVPRDDDEAMRLYQKAHRNGCTWAARQIGDHYARGRGVKVDYAKAVEWYQFSADKGDGPALTRLAGCYYEGRGVPKDVNKAKELWQKAANAGDEEAKKALAALPKSAQKPTTEAEKTWLAAAKKGDAEARYQLGRGHYYGQKGSKVDQAEAVRWFRLAEKQDHPDATAFLGFCFASGHGVALDYAEAMRLYQKAHKDGCTWAARQIGFLHAGGQGVKEDHAEAVTWFQRSADKNDEQAWSALASCYFDGRGVAKDREKARKFWAAAAAKNDEAAKKALAALEKNRDASEGERLYLADAEKGDAFAQACLGCAYAFGERGTKRDPVKGAEWLKKAADQGDVHAQANLGCLYHTGDGVEKDAKKAVELWEKAVVKKHAVALNNLGWAYENGIGGLTVDLPQAARLYGEAARQNWPSSQWHLSKLYREGRGVKKDVAEADRLLKLAADGGLAEAKADLAKRQEKKKEKDKNEGKGDDQVKRWRQEAAKGDAGAQESLGYALAFGTHGLEADPTEGAKWLKQAADQGNDRAHVHLGYLHHRGLGVAQDYKEAARRYKLALAKLKEPTAMVNLATLYLSGDGVDRDPDEAVRLYREAVKLNHPSAQYRLAVLLREGTVVKKDVAEADRLLKLAADGGEERAKADLAKRPKEAPPPKADVRGVAKQVKITGSGDELGGAFFVEGQKEADTEFSKGRLTVSPATKFYRWVNGKKAAANPDDVKEGSKLQCILVNSKSAVEVVVGTASEVIILEDPKKK